MILPKDEEDWFRLACALANEFGENGRSYFQVAFHNIYPEYDPIQTDKKFTHALCSQKIYPESEIGTFLQDCFLLSILLDKSPPLLFFPIFIACSILILIRSSTVLMSPADEDDAGSYLCLFSRERKRFNGAID